MFGLRPTVSGLVMLYPPSSYSTRSLANTQAINALDLMLASTNLRLLLVKVLCRTSATAGTIVPTGIVYLNQLNCTPFSCIDDRMMSAHDAFSLCCAPLPLTGAAP